MPKPLLSTSQVKSRFRRKLLTEWRRLGLTVHDSVLLAVSGGADSVALLLAFADLRREGKWRGSVVVAHLNHNLRSEAAADATWVQQLCEKQGLPYVTETLDPAVWNAPGNIEQTARHLRYAFLRRVAVEQRLTNVLTAHTVDDQAETFLLRLIRGGGSTGLAGMRPLLPLLAESPVESPLAVESRTSISLARPLLRWARRADTEALCAAHYVTPRTDAMNHDLDFVRVRLRHEILPALAALNPNIHETLGRTAEILAAEDEYLTTVAAALLPATPSTNLPLTLLASLPTPLQVRVVRAWLIANRGSLRRLTRHHFHAVISLATKSSAGRTVELPGGQQIVRKANHLFFTPHLTPEPLREK